MYELYSSQIQLARIMGEGKIIAIFVSGATNSREVVNTICRRNVDRQKGVSLRSRPNMGVKLGRMTGVDW